MFWKAHGKNLHKNVTQSKEKKLGRNHRLQGRRSRSPSVFTHTPSTITHASTHWEAEYHACPNKSTAETLNGENAHTSIYQHFNIFFSFKKWMPTVLAYEKKHLWRSNYWDSVVFEEVVTNSLVYSLHSQHGTLKRSHILVKAMGPHTNSNCAINKLCFTVSLSLSFLCIKQV